MVLKILRSCEETKCKRGKMEKHKERDKIERRLYLLAQWPPSAVYSRIYCLYCEPNI